MSPKLLNQEAKHLFTSFLQPLGVEININPIPYFESPVEVVTDAYLRHKMVEHKKRLKDLVHDTGIDKSNLSAWINGIREMSQPVKAMFYSYFESLNRKVTYSSEQHGPDSNLGQMSIRLARGLTEHYNSEVKVTPFVRFPDSCVFLFYVENLDITNHFPLTLKAVDELINDSDFYDKNVRNIISVIDSRFYIRN
ncbi:helix-turn-helix domain-containing protein [Dyadobacter bucti]|uniref:helix-turn-helix domain-containing protein n=1 Tax=Dyadobacter bucti TaxID=2572203 RepID=UPI001108C7BC|nr:helix-turn-helix transcriptional regulator [Dyadobacter bucti]